MELNADAGPPTFWPRRAKPMEAPKQPLTSKILVVEDSPSARRLLHAIFLELGVDRANLRLVETEAAAREMFAQWKPDVVFIDLVLGPTPEKPTGYTLGREAETGTPSEGASLARQFLKANPSIKIVICSATDPAESPVGDLVRSGTFQGVLKPIWASKIQEALARASVTGPPPNRGPLAVG
jgi:CheY-like chemotaxis protein